MKSSIKKLEYMKEYRQRPEVNKGKREYDKKYREEHKDELKKWKKENYEENKEEILRKQQEYNKRPEVKKRHMITCKEWKRKNKKRVLELEKGYRERNREKIRESNKTYKKSKKGKISIMKDKNKRRKLGSLIFIPNFFPDNIRIHYHHINNLFVISLPAITHTNCSCHSREIHREKANMWIEKLYNLNLNEFGVI